MPIPGFTPHGGRYRLGSGLAEKTARWLADEAARRGCSAGAVVDALVEAQPAPLVAVPLADVATSTLQAEVRRRRSR